MNELTAFLRGVMTRPKFDAIEAELLKRPQLKPAMRHYWAPGTYCREIFLPACCCVTGKIHLHPHTSIVLGDIVVCTPGQEPERITGFQTVLAPAGIKRAVFTYADTWWTTVHANPTNERDLAKLEAMLIVDEFRELDARIGALA